MTSGIDSLVVQEASPGSSETYFDVSSSPDASEPDAHIDENAPEVSTEYCETPRLRRLATAEKVQEENVGHDVLMSKLPKKTCTKFSRIISSEDEHCSGGSPLPSRLAKTTGSVDIPQLSFSYLQQGASFREATHRENSSDTDTSPVCRTARGFRVTPLLTNKPLTKLQELRILEHMLKQQTKPANGTTALRNKDSVPITPRVQKAEDVQDSLKVYKGVSREHASFPSFPHATLYSETAATPTVKQPFGLPSFDDSPQQPHHNSLDLPPLQTSPRHRHNAQSTQKTPNLALSLRERLALRRDKQADDLSQKTPSGPQETSSSPKAPPQTPIRTPTSIAALQTTARRRHFKQEREKIAASLFQKFNRIVFHERLPHDLPLVWNPRLTRTAGQTIMRTNSISGRTCSIQLSCKVLDDEHRLASTLLHELCHVAQFLLEEEIRPAHGPGFQRWQRIAQARCPEIPVTVTHDYEIYEPYQYICLMCSQTFGRHTKLKTPEGARCGNCQGPLEYLGHFNVSGEKIPESTRPLTPYNIFVKEHFSKVKETHPQLTYNEILKHVAEAWKNVKAQRQEEKGLQLRSSALLRETD